MRSMALYIVTSAVMFVILALAVGSSLPAVGNAQQQLKDAEQMVLELDSPEKFCTGESTLDIDPTLIKIACESR